MNKGVISKIPSPNFLSENRRGQVTIFIIIAIILVAAVSLYFIFKDKISVENIPSEIEPVYTQIISCLKETNKQGVEYLGMHGGYYEIPEAISISYFSDNIPYYYLNSKTYIPSIERVEGELEDYIHNYLSNCLGFESFKEQGYGINEGDLLVSVNVKENQIKTKLDYPLTITKGDSTKRLREFEIESNSEISNLLEVSKEIVNSYLENPGFVCLTCLEEISNNNGMQITSAPFSNYEEESIFFLVTSYETELNWKFAVEQ